MSMLRKMVKGGYRRKGDTYNYVLSNSDILQHCKTENIHQFISRQQRNFVAHIIRGENNRTTKRLLFNDNTKVKRGRHPNLYKTVLQNENVSSDVHFFFYEHKLYKHTEAEKAQKIKHKTSII